jgi:hypothetical protein
MPLRKQYVLVSSDDRTSTSVSTTDFDVELREPINNVVKTDLVNVSMDYNMANIVAPNNTFSVSTYQQTAAAIEAYDEVVPAVPAVVVHHEAVPAETHNEVTAVAGWYFQAIDTEGYVLLEGYSRTGDVGHYAPRTGEAAGDYWNRAEEYIVVVDVPAVEAYDEIITPEVPESTISHPAVPAVYGNVSQSYSIDEEQYTPAELRAALEELLGGQDGYFDVMLVNRNLRIEYWFAETTTTSEQRHFTLTCSNSTLKLTLGMTGNTLTGTYVPTIGDMGGSRITFPRAIRLPANAPFIMIQSKALGITTKTSNGRGFWRALINDPSQDQMIVSNQRSDDILEEPRRLQEIDIKLGFPDGSKVDNRGAAFSILLEVLTDEGVKGKTN